MGLVTANEGIITVDNEPLERRRIRDMIHVLDAGRLVKSRTWETLLSVLGGRHRQLCAAHDMAGAAATAGLLRV